MSMVMPSLFQFHKGTIKTRSRIAVVAHVIRFNSIKVRLRLLNNEPKVDVFMFQFHKGTIKT